MSPSAFRNFMPQVSQASLGDDNGASGPAINLPSQTFQTSQTSGEGADNGVVVQEEITAGVVVQEEITAGVVQEELNAGRLGNDEKHFTLFIHTISEKLSGIIQKLKGK